MQFDFNDDSDHFEAGKTSSASCHTDPALASDGLGDGEAIVLADFLHHLDELDLPIAQKLLLLEAISAIMRSFVDQAFGLDETQLALAAQENGANSQQDLVELNRSPTTEFRRIQCKGE